MRFSLKNSVIYLVFFGLFLLTFKEIFAETVATSVIVGNSAPAFTVQPFEVTASYVASPTNVGTTVTFQATGTDGNGENYYLAICKTNAITANNNAVPTCTGGNWCISGSTTSGSSTTCGYGTLQATAESNTWYAFVCDYSPSSVCSAMSQGAGNNGSPFEVNHAPSFVSIGNTTPLNPGSTETWTTSIGTSDADTGDTVNLLVCKTAGITGNACDGGTSDTWCTGSGVANTPNCSIGISIPTLDVGYSAYVYAFDQHSFGASGGTQGSLSGYVVNNVAPVVSAITLNGGSAISLSEGTSIPVVLGATITDNNGCSDISTVVSSLYRSGIGYSACDTGGESNSNNCYGAISCSIGGGNTCDGATDASASYTCTPNVKYYADPTDANTSYSGQTWNDTFKASDESLNDAQTIGSGVVMNSLLAMDLGSSLAFGNISAGQTQTPLTSLTTVIATGNVGLDQTLEGTDMSDGQSHTITVGNQRYSLASATAYSVATSLTTSGVGVSLSCAKTTTDVGATKPTYWGISIPVGTVAGTYSGTNTIIAVKSAFARW
jgi:hypothetical protein